MTASDLAEYAYCPRAQWYRTHPPAEGPAPSSVDARSRGERFHARTLVARSRREQWSSLWWFLITTGLLLCLLGFVLAGRL